MKLYCSEVLFQFLFVLQYFVEFSCFAPCFRIVSWSLSVSVGFWTFLLLWILTFWARWRPRSRRGSCHVNHFGFTSREPPKTQYKDCGVNASNFVWSWKPYPTTLLFLSNHGSFGFSCFWIDETFVCSCFCQTSFVPRPVRFFLCSMRENWTMIKDS